MKRIYKFKAIIIIVIGLLLVTSCGDDFLNPEPKSFFSPENIYVDKDGIEGALLYCRREIRWDYVDVFNASFNLENVGSDMYAQGNWRARFLHDWNTQMTTLVGGGQLPHIAHRYYWERGYNIIRNANTVISRIDAPVWTSEAEKNAILAEALFFRAYIYYRFVMQYGDVPFLGVEYTQPKIDFYTTCRFAIMEKIQEDLEWAVQWLPELAPHGKTRKAAANHLLTQVYLTNSEFDKAIAAASAVINDGIHSLMTERFGKVAGNDRFNVIWDLHQSDNKISPANTEGILVAQERYNMPGVSTETRGGGSWSMVNYTPRKTSIRTSDGMMAILETPGTDIVMSVGRGWGDDRPTSYTSYGIWVDSGDDLRHCSDTNWMTMEKLYVNNPLSVDYLGPLSKEHYRGIDTIDSWYPWPHYKIYMEDPINPLQPAGGPSNMYIYRLAWTYLLRAEAYWWKGELGNAAADINAVRERALAPPITAADVTLEYILDERARELQLEEPRSSELTRIAMIFADNNLNGYSRENFATNNWWFDRVDEIHDYYNKDNVVDWGTPYRISTFHVYWPVPQDAIDSNTKGVMNQNLGYPGAENNIPPTTDINFND